MRASSAISCALTLAIALAGGTGVSAHRLDEYLQAARIALQPDGVTINLDLTPGVAVAEPIIASIDSDRDGSLSQDEQRAYAGQVVRAQTIKVDGRPHSLDLVSWSFPELEALRRGEDAIRLHVRATLPSVSEGPHQLFFRNSHVPQPSAYLANALVPESARVSVTAQRRDGDQRELTIEYAVGAESTSSTPAWLLVGLIVAAVLMVRLREALAT